MLKIKETENVFVTEIKKAKAQGKSIYILGAALGAKRIAYGLKFKGLDFDAFVVDKEYYTPNMKYLDKDVLCLYDLDANESVFIRSIANYPRLNEIKNRMQMIDEDVLSLSMVASDPLDLKYIQTNFNQFNNFYNSLEDDESKAVMEAYLNQKITGRFSEMSKVWRKVQYFDGDFYDLSKVNCIVDCGAYIGDSFLSFCDEYEKQSGMAFKGTGFLFDPDENNQILIKKNCSGCKAEVIGIKAGVLDKKGKMAFQSDDNYGNAGKISDIGDIEIDVETIDEIVMDRTVDFIKMDIEGVELRALRGGETTIKKNHPILAICAYHKREDILELSDYIRSLYKGYKFYLRAYGGPYSIELVLYAVV
ncbi:MAG: FkbM family methyltransferase [Lachnospiraceae bacterium]|nr:FkbM family methyltransferase [Lachnospiraceae bacterium]